MASQRSDRKVAGLNVCVMGHNDRFCPVVTLEGFPCPNLKMANDEIDVAITTVLQLIAAGSTVQLTGGTVLSVMQIYLTALRPYKTAHNDSQRKA
jgi:hypothetical protein